jgi:streptogramin lyase
MIRPVNSAKRPYLRWKTSAACNAGQIAVVSGGLALPAAENCSAATVLGVFVEDAASGALAYIYPGNQEFEFDVYQGSTVDEVTLAMQGVAYDIYVDGAAGDDSAEGETYLDLNDTSTGFVVVSNYDNKRRVATGSFLQAQLYV